MSEARELLEKVIKANGLFGDLKEEIDAYLAKPEPDPVAYMRYAQSWDKKSTVAVACKKDVAGGFPVYTKKL